MSIHVKIFNSHAVILINEGEQNMQWDKIELASRMQNYIREHCMDEDFQHGCAVCVHRLFKRHACRIFKELLYKTPEEYVRAVQMTAKRGISN